MILTEEQIEAGKTKKGGFSRAQLQKWGVPWPPPRGWKRKLMGKPEQPDADFQNGQLRMTLTGDRYHKLCEMADMTAIEVHQYALIMLSKAVDQGEYLETADWWQGTPDGKARFNKDFEAATERVRAEMDKLVPAESYFPEE